MKPPQSSPSSFSRRLITSFAAIALVAIGTLVPTASASAASGFVSPVSGHVADIVGGCPGGTRPNHEGVDINGNGGSAVYAAASGVVTTAVTSNATTGYGTQIVVTHADGYTTRYAHMVAGSLTVSQGATVSQGQRIGTVGSTGNSTGAHMHFEIKRNGANISNQYFSCGQGNVTALQYLGTGPTGPSDFDADYNSDGKADLLGVTSAGNLVLYRGTGTGGFQAATTVGPGWATRKHLTHTDFNSDGKADILVARPDGALEFYPGTGSGGFGSVTTPGAGWYTMLHVTSGADYTGDGKQDVLGVNSAGTLTIFGGNGTGGFSGTNYALGGGWQNYLFIVGGDFNNDGKGDIMGVDNTGALYFYPGITAGFGSKQLIGGGWQTYTAMTGGADYNGDGKADLLARDSSGNLYRLLGNGSGSFSSTTQVGPGWGSYLQIE